MALLVFQRFEGEEIWIGPPGNPTIRVRLVKCLDGRRARIAIDAPLEIQVNRREVAERKAIEAAENAAACGESPAP